MEQLKFELSLYFLQTSKHFGGLVSFDFKYKSRCLVKQMPKYYPMSYNIAKPPTRNRLFREIPIQSMFHAVEFLNSNEHKDFFYKRQDQKAKRENAACRVPRPGYR